MRSWLLPTLAAAALYGGAVLTVPASGGDLARFGRHLVRPAVLPFLWRGLADATRRGSIGEVVARGRTLMQLIPRWTDGHIHFAWLLALDASRAARTVDEALDRLLAAGILLGEAAESAREDAAEFWIARAFLLELRTRGDAELTALFTERVGRSPLQAAAADLERAAAGSTRLDVRERQAFLTKRMIGPPLRAGQIDQARELVDMALERLGAVERALRGEGNAVSADNAAEHRASLLRLRAWLAGEPGVAEEELRRDRYLEDIFEGW